MKTTKEIVIKRTGIEYTYNDDDKLQYIEMSIMVYMPGFEYSTCGRYDEDDWEYHAESDSWRCVSKCDELDGTPYGLAMFLGLDNTEVITQVLNELTLENRESVTVNYTIDVDISPGSKLPVCGQCMHWVSDKHGYCNLCKQHISVDHVIPCSREVFKPKNSNSDK